MSIDLNLARKLGKSSFNPIPLFEAKLTCKTCRTIQYKVLNAMQAQIGVFWCAKCNEPKMFEIENLAEKVKVILI